MALNRTKWFPRITIPSVSKSLLPGANKLKTKNMLRISYDFYKNKKNIPGGAYKRASQLNITKKYQTNTETIAAVFPRGPKRRNPTMTTTMITAKRKVNNIKLRENCF